MSRTAIDTDTNGERPPPEDDRAFLGHPRGLPSLSGLEVRERFSFLGMQAILGPIRYVAGRRHLAGRRHSAEFGVALGGLSFLLMALPTSGRAGDTYETAAWWIVGSYLLLGLGVIALAPWPRRTMHPVH
nr:hypothetical protein [Streptomyces sp. SS]